MALTATLVESTGYRLIYLLTNASTFGTTITIPNDGGATPDLLTDLSTAPSGPLRAIVRARLDGIGTIVAGALSQAQARAILNSDRTTGVGNDNVPVATLNIRARSGTAPFSVDANVDGGGDPVVVVTTTAVASTAYLDIYVRHTYDF
jgi:hypothetical protein